MSGLLLLGLPLSQLLTVLGAGASLLTVLYLLKQQRRRIEVPFAQLWQKILSQTESRSWWRKLARFLSWLLQLLVLALLVSALGDPRLGRSSQGRSLVLMIDASASMQAVVPGPSGLTRLDLAKRQAKALVHGLSGDDLAVVVALDGQPAPQGGLSFEERELAAQIDAVTARDTPADLVSALTLSQALLAGRPSPRVILFSDGGFDDLTLAQARTDLDVRFSPLPQSVMSASEQPGVGNAAITALAVRRYRKNRLSYEVLVSLAWFPAKTATVGEVVKRQPVTLELLQEGELVDVQQLELSPGEQQEKLYPNLSGSGTHLEARLRLPAGQTDLLALDNQAYAVLPERQRQRLLIVTAGNLFLEGALLSAGAGEENHLVIEKTTPAAYTAEKAARFDVVMFDGFTPKSPPDAHALYLDPRGEDSPFAVVGEVKRPLLSEVDSTHPVLRWVSLGDVNMSRSSVFRPLPGDRVLASMVKQPLMLAREESGPSGHLRRSVALGFDTRQSDLPLRVAFPVLLMNALDWFAGELDDDLGSYRTGQTWRVPIVGAQQGRRSGRPDAQALQLTSATLMLPAGDVVPVPVYEGQALYYGQQAGFYALRAGAAPVLWAANLSDLGESAVRLRTELKLGDRLLPSPDAGQPTLRRELWPLLVLLALVLMWLEWWSYHRRWTV
ncbi:MAG TPA: VWA domain-containing protein [Pseudomonadota bacterium]|nr:VWA domain-containing protein [Pseudomonadota bacterium]